MRRKAFISLALVAVLSFAAPSALSSGATTSPEDASCSRRNTTRLVKRFVRAFNGAKVDHLDRLWAHEPDFQWYFVDDEREQPDAEDRLTLRFYFEERVRLNDHLQLRHLHVNQKGTDFAFKLLRTTDDERDDADGLLHGKGAARESPPLPSLGEPVPTPTCLLVVWAMDNHTS